MRTPRRFVVGHGAAAILLLAFGASSVAAADLQKDCRSHQVAACTEILRANPSDLNALGNRGIGYRIAGEYARAIADLDAALRLDPRIAGLYLERGLALEAKGEHRLAIADFNDAIERQPALVQAHFGRAMAYEATGQRELSVADLGNATRLDRNMVGALHMQRGYELRTARKYDDAITAFDRAIEVNSNWLSAYFGRGASFDDKGDAERAAADFRKCIEMPANSELERQRQQDARQRLAKLGRP